MASLGWFNARKRARSFSRPRPVPSELALKWPKGERSNSTGDVIPNRWQSNPEPLTHNLGRFDQPFAETLLIGRNQVAVTPDGTLADVADRFSSDVSVFDTSSHTVLTRVPVDKGPFGVA